MARADVAEASLESAPTEAPTAQLQTPTEAAPEPRRLEAQNVKPDLSQYDQLRLRHSINLLPGAKKSTKSVKSHSSHRRLNGEADDDYSGEAHEETTATITTDVLTTHDVPTHLDSSEASLYEEGTGLFVAQEQKRILLLQFYEVILNNPSRTPQVDPRIIKLMTNYLQTLEYVYVKQIQHHEESPPVLYDFRVDNETASFCDSPPVSLPDQKFLNEDDDYFVKLFDQYNQQQLGVYMSPTQLKQQGLFRKLARHLAEVQVSEKSRIERERRLAQAAEAPQERQLKGKADTDTKAADGAKADASKGAPTKFKVIKPMDLDVNSDFDYWVPPTPKRTRKAKAKSEVAPESQTTLGSQPDANNRKLQRIQRVRRAPIRENVDGDFPAPIDDPFPIQNPHVYRENIHEDTMEILEFFSRQLQIIFERMDRLNNANRGLERWRIKPHWRDFEQAMQYFQALGSRTNRITDVLDLVIAGTGEQVGVGFMGHFFGQFHRIQDLNRRINNLNHAHSTANIHLRNMHSNIHAMRSSMAGTPPTRHQHLNQQIAVQQMAVGRQSGMVSSLRQRMNRAQSFQNRATTLANWFNGLGNAVAKDARYIRLEYIKLELMARNLLQTTTVDMTRPRNQRMCLRFFEATIPQLVVIKNEIRRGIRQIMPKMQRLLDARERVLSFMHEWVNSANRRVKLKKSRKMKAEETGKGLI